MTNIGSASMPGESSALYISVTMTRLGMRVPENNRNTMHDSARLNAIGTPRTMNTPSGRNR